MIDGGFDPSNLRLARLVNELSQAELADCVGKSRQFLARVEAGIDKPSDELVELVSEALDFSPQFFFQKNSKRYAEEAFHFRKLATTKSIDKNYASAKGEMFGYFWSYVSSKILMPQFDFPQIETNSVEAIERAAESCRRHWGLGLGPIDNCIRMMENAGAVVTGFVSNKAIDALTITDQNPIVIVNTSDSAGRLRFSYAHECAHLVLHFGRQTGDAVTEAEANRFASALLLPRSSFVNEFPALRGKGQINWKALVEMKSRWKVSKAALLYRAKQLEVISEATYKSALIHGLYARGQRKSEIDDHLIQMEQSEVLPAAINVLKETYHVTAKSITQDIGIGIRSLAKVLPANLINHLEADHLSKDDNVITVNFNKSPAASPFYN